MKYFFLGVMLLWVSAGLRAQELDPDALPDSKYLEDQFYLGVTYNFLLDRPTDVKQQNLSYGLQAGLIKDIPINADRTMALGVGLGLGLNAYYSNMLVSEVPGGFSYSVLDDEARYKRNKIETHTIEMPLEVRWRNSTAEDYKFWRIYGGVKLAYVAGARSKFVSDDEKVSFYNTDVERFKYGLTLNFGYNTFNLHIYYALQNLFKHGTTLNGENIELRPLRVGFIFYIL